MIFEVEGFQIEQFSDSLVSSCMAVLVLGKVPQVRVLGDGGPCSWERSTVSGPPSFLLLPSEQRLWSNYYRLGRRKGKEKPFSG